MPRRTPQQIADLWKKNLGAAGDKIKSGVAAVTESPGIKAAQQQDLMRQRLLDAIDSGRWAQAVSSVQLPDWKQSMVTTGLANMQNGLAKGATGQIKYQTLAAPVYDQISQQAAQIPKDGTDATALAKVAVAIKGMRGLKGRMRTG